MSGLRRSDDIGRQKAVSGMSRNLKRIARGWPALSRDLTSSASAQTQAPHRLRLIQHRTAIATPPAARGRPSMNAIVKAEQGMALQERVTRIEVEVIHIRSDINDLKTEVRDHRGEGRDLRADVNELRTEIHSFKTDVAKEFGSLRAGFSDFKTEVAKEFGSVRTAIEQSKLWMPATGLFTIVSVCVEC